MALLLLYVSVHLVGNSLEVSTEMAAVAVLHDDSWNAERCTVGTRCLGEEDVHTG